MSLYLLSLRVASFSANRGIDFDTVDHIVLTGASILGPRPRDYILCPDLQENVKRSLGRKEMKLHYEEDDVLTFTLGTAGGGERQGHRSRTAVASEH